MQQAKLTREHILLVEPDAGTRMRTLALLRELHYAVASCATAADALVYLRHAPFAVVMSELALPETSGLRLLEDVLAAHGETAVVLMTDGAQPEMLVEAFRRGAADLLLKPLHASGVEAALRTAMAERGGRRATIGYVRQLEALLDERTGLLGQMMADLERSYDVTIEAMGDALDMRDEETEGHSKRVTAYTVALARAMGLPAAELKVIARGAFLHDIGKIAIPDAILLKPGKLTPEEMVVMQSHCAQGYAIVRKIPFLREASEIVRAHQERWDGGGYPEGLKGEEIPLGSRIFAVADTLDAITSDRPYRRGRSFAEAIAEIDRCRGTQFDPAVVDVFLAMPEATWPAIRAEVGRQTHAAELVRAAVAA